MKEITSTTNYTVKETAKLQQKKYRESSNLFIIEGEKAIKGFYNEGYIIKTLFVKSQMESLFKNIQAENKYLTNEAVLSKITTTKNPCYAIAVAEQKSYKIKDFLKIKKIVLLENIKDAGNLGTILRVCKAFNIEGIMLLGETVDLYNPKVIRASVGCFNIPTINIKIEDLSLFENYCIYSTALYENSISLEDVEFKEPLIIAFGAESNGLSKEFTEKTTTNIKIETSTCVESLNLASAVSICLYKIFTNTI